jgi:hypothetical protein
MTAAPASRAAIMPRQGAGGWFLSFAQAASSSPLAAEPITVASMSVPLRTQAPLDSRSRVIASKRLRSSPCTASKRRKRTKAVRSGVSSSRAKPQKRHRPAGKRFRQHHIGKIMPIASKSALNIARGGHAFSPLAEG